MSQLAARLSQTRECVRQNLPAEASSTVGWRQAPQLCSVQSPRSTSTRNGCVMVLSFGMTCYAATVAGTITHKNE